MKEEYVSNDEILNIVNEIVEDDKTIEDLKEIYPDKINELEEALLDYMGEHDLKIIKTEFLDKWKHLTKKLAYPYEYFLIVSMIIESLLIIWKIKISSVI